MKASGEAGTTGRGGSLVHSQSIAECRAKIRPQRPLRRSRLAIRKDYFDAASGIGTTKRPSTDLSSITRGDLVLSAASSAFGSLAFDLDLHFSLVSGEAHCSFVSANA